MVKFFWINLFFALFFRPLFAFDAETGFEINEVCAGCHGEFGEGGKGGVYPRIAGLPFDYLVTQLKGFKSRKRINIPMEPYTKERELPDEDILDVSGFLSEITLITKMPPLNTGKKFNAYERLKIAKSVLNIPRFNADFAKGKKIYLQDCKSCHKKDGTGKTKHNIPTIAGQWTKYLKKQLLNYQNGSRVHDEEETKDNIFTNYTKDDIDNLLAYLSILDD